MNRSRNNVVMQEWFRVIYCVSYVQVAAFLRFRLTHRIDGLRADNSLTSADRTALSSWSNLSLSVISWHRPTPGSYSIGAKGFEDSKSRRPLRQTHQKRLTNKTEHHHVETFPSKGLTYRQYIYSIHRETCNIRTTRTVNDADGAAERVSTTANQHSLSLNEIYTFLDIGGQLTIKGLPYLSENRATRTSYTRGMSKGSDSEATKSKLSDTNNNSTTVFKVGEAQIVNGWGQNISSAGCKQ